VRLPVRSSPIPALSLWMMVGSDPAKRSRFKCRQVCPLLRRGAENRIGRLDLADCPFQLATFFGLFGFAPETSFGRPRSSCLNVFTERLCGFGSAIFPVVSFISLANFYFHTRSALTPWFICFASHLPRVGLCSQAFRPAPPPSMNALLLTPLGQLSLLPYPLKQLRGTAYPPPPAAHIYSS